MHNSGEYISLPQNHVFPMIDQCCDRIGNLALCGTHAKFQILKFKLTVLTISYWSLGANIVHVFMTIYYVVAFKDICLNIESYQETS